MNRLVKYRIVEAMKERSSFLESKFNKHTVKHNTDRDIPTILLEIEDAAQAIAKLEIGNEVFIGAGKYLEKQKKMGERILSALKITALLHDLFQGQTLNPYIAKFMSHAESSKAIHLPHNALNYINLTTNEVTILNKFVATLRDELNNAKFTYTNNNFHRNTNENETTLREYIAALFEYHPKIQIIRLDLSYSTIYSNSPYIEIPLVKNVTTANKSKFLFINSLVNKTPYVITDFINPHQAIEARYIEAKKNWADLLRYLKRSFLKDSLFGYAWKLNYDVKKSYYYHLIIFLDPSKTTKSVNIAKAIGEHWQNSIAKNSGIYYQCDSNPKGYRGCATGVFNRKDLKKWDQIDRAILYMIKTDHFVKTVLPEKGRTFDKGRTPAIKPTDSKSQDGTKEKAKNKSESLEPSITIAANEPSVELNQAESLKDPISTLVKPSQVKVKIRKPKIMRL